MLSIIYNKLISKKATTLTELIIYSAILGIVVMAVIMFFTRSNISIQKSQLKVEAQEDVRVVLIEMEMDLGEANQIIASSSTAIDFICDYNKHPNYNFWGDTDSDGIINIQDPDDDNDASLIQPPTAQWKVGYDLNDDDDDDDNQIDVKIRFYWDSSAKKIYKDAAYNGEAWGNHIDMLGEHISSFTVTYYGAKRNDLGKYIDLGNDGVSGTSDVGENDGIISATEIDMVQTPTGHGNRNGRIDTNIEMKYINSIEIYIEMDKNEDGISDYNIRTEITPQLLTLKNKS